MPCSKPRASTPRSARACARRASVGRRLQPSAALANRALYGLRRAYGWRHVADARTACIGTTNPASVAYLSITSCRTAARIASSAGGVCARSTAAVRTPPRDIASNSASGDDSGQVSASGCHLHVREAGAIERPPHFIRIAEPEERRTLGQRDAGIPKRFNRAQHHAEADGVIRARPDGEAVAAARPQHTVRFGDRRVGLRQVEQAEVHHHRVEAGGVERQRFGVAFAKRDRRDAAAARPRSSRREVEADRLRAARGRGGGDEAGAARDVEQTRARSRADRVEQRVGGLRSSACRTRRRSEPRRRSQPHCSNSMKRRSRIDSGHRQLRPFRCYDA